MVLTSLFFTSICAVFIFTSASGQRAPRGSVCGSNGVKYLSHCAFVLATCRPNNRRFDNIVAVSMKYCETKTLHQLPREQKALVCDLNGVTYQACDILKRRCSRRKRKKKRNSLHLGACGNCSRENVCDWGKTDALIEKIISGKICSGDDEYEDRCAFYMARCKQYKKDKTVLKIKKCADISGTKNAEKHIRIKKGSICGSDGRKYENFCTYMQATCKPNNRSHDTIFPVEMQYCEDETLKMPRGTKASLCGTNGITYQACQLGLQICHRKKSVIVPLHLGKCDVCTKENICTWEEMENIIAVQEGRRKVCARGVTYTSKCAFSIARCKQYKMDKTILKGGNCRIRE